MQDACFPQVRDHKEDAEKRVLRKSTLRLIANKAEVAARVGAVKCVKPSSECHAERVKIKNAAVASPRNLALKKSGRLPLI